LVFNLLLFLVFSPVMLLIFHMFVVRLVSLSGKPVSMQKLLVQCIVLFNLPVMFISLVIINSNGSETISWLIYSFLMFNSMAYCYFHFFNMSETARRIRILVGIKSGRVKTIEDMDKFYDTKGILNNRLERLEQFSQIYSDAASVYFVKKRLLFCVSLLVNMWRKLLRFDR